MLICPTIRRALLSCVALSAILSRDASGQAVSTPQCDSATTIVAKGHPRQSDDWAFAAVMSCGAAGARALRTAIPTYRSETDVAALQRFMTQVDNWRDASIFDAMTELAMNNAASPQARVFAVRHLILLLQPNLLLTYAGMTRKADTTVLNGMATWQESGCVAQMTSVRRGFSKGSPLPPDYQARIRATLKALGSSPTVPEPVRFASRCW
jgi:hypothetical protein